MNFPEGASHHPRQERLIAKDQSAIIRIDTHIANNAGYYIKDRVFEKAIAPYLHGDWEDFDRLFCLEPPCPDRVVYSGAAHSQQPKLPNITVIPNLSTQESRGVPRPFTVLGCTMGHFHEPIEGAPDYWVQEVYEFQSYGLLVLDRQTGEVEMWVAQDGDKVSVPNGCHMTLYNLGDEDDPLVTLDFADPERNPSNKELIRQCGPILLAYYNDFEVVFVLNRLYINSTDHKAGVRLTDPPTEERDRQVRIARGSRLNLGQFLYEQLTQNPDVIGRFARLGIRIRRASRESVLEPLPSGRSPRLYFSRPLVEAAQPGTEVYRYFFPGIGGASRASPSPSGSIAAEERRRAEEKARRIAGQEEQPVDRLAIVVEGAGDWVERCYRPLFKKKVSQGAMLSVYYADDTRWTGSRPAWADPNDPAYDLQDWETYLDKANPHDFAVYQQLTPDVVFIVTPDFTHSALARWWLNRAPTVFVEKPFDSQLDNVDGLVSEMGLSQPNTAVLGLDHYQFYALPLHDLLPEIERHLGGALAKAVFYMTEDRPIELHRVRTLQYGLTLDFLPHFPALLSYFGKVSTIDDIEVIEAGQYEPLIARDPKTGQEENIEDRFYNEAYSRVRFTFQDYSGSGHRVPCLAVVGKGFSQGVKYFEVIGRNGNGIRVDLNRPPDPNPAPDYPWDSVFFLMQGDQVRPPTGTRVRTVQDPYDPQRTLHVLEDPKNPSRFHRRLEREIYEKLLDDLLNGTRTAVASTLLLPEAYEIVRALDRIWEAVQDWKAMQPSEAWLEYDLKQLNPIQPGDDP